MRTVAAAAVALLAGLFLGGIRPRAELRQAQRDLAEAREAAAHGGSAAALPLALGVGSLVAARDRARSVPRFLGPDGGAATVSDDKEGSGNGDDRRRRRRGWFGDGGAERFAAVKAAADVRAAQFRAAFVDEAHLSPERQTTLDQAIDGMNSQLARAVDEITASIRTRPPGQKVRPREMADIGARLLDVYRRADDSFAASLDEQGRAARERTEFDLLTQVDLEPLRTLGETLESVGVTRVGPGAR
jgi:hypothetical protein